MKSNPKYFTLFFFLTATLGWGLVVAQLEVLQVETAGDISYVSGGVGASEQEALEQVKSEYNLLLSFAVSDSGAFLAEIPVTIADKNNQILLESVSAGPHFYARVSPGEYRVSAVRAGQVQTQSVTVPATGAVPVDFRWAVE